ncbi:MAG TPA: DUF296 domain-containing protein [Patescibacteria group bacterium]|nr:DUF296 domain-containing protein [Patescibacteria group bacterium]
MKYASGTLGRVFVLKFDNGDAVLETLADFAKKQRLKAATIIFLGALKKGKLVTGPKKPVVPPEPSQVDFDGGWETMGIGTIFTNALGPQIHIHSAMGKKRKTLTGCLRKGSGVFLVIEAVVFELKGVKATKDLDPATGLNLLKIL